MRAPQAEDDAPLGEAIASFLKRAGHAVDWLRDGVAADAALRSPTASPDSTPRPTTTS